MSDSNEQKDIKDEVTEWEEYINNLETVSFMYFKNYHIEKTEYGYLLSNGKMSAGIIDTEHNKNYMCLREDVMRAIENMIEQQKMMIVSCIVEKINEIDKN